MDDASQATDEVSVYAIAAELLTASEAIHAALVGVGELDDLEPAYEVRAKVFGRLQSAIKGGARLDAAARACIQRVRQLDEEILELGKVRGDAMREERQGLMRRRAASKAHSVRERGGPRVITLKA